MIQGILIGEGLLWALGRRKRYFVYGDSMKSTVHHGRQVLVRPIRIRAPRCGDLVVARHPFKNILILKRIKKVRGQAIHQKEYFLLGDQATASADSRSFGWVQHAGILGTVTMII